MSHREYINSHHKAKYKGIVKYCYSYLSESVYIISSIGEDDLSLPTFENQTSSVLENVKILMEMGLMNRKEAVKYINQQNIDFNLVF